MIVKSIFINLVLLLCFSFIEANEFFGAQEPCNDKKVIGLTVPDSTDSGLIFFKENTYQNEKRKIRKIRILLKQRYLLLKDSVNKSQFLDSVSIVFSNLLLNSVVPHWYGTSWDFNGYTSVPNQGEIACGYFVSTTLNHMDLNLNRYHLARQNPLNEARSIAIDNNSVFVFSSDTYSINNKFFKSFKNGLYFIGLDSHVGYLYIYNKEAFFLHSNYIEDRVMIESIDYSEAFDSSNYSIVKITGNKLLMKKWVLGSQIKVCKE